MTPPLHHSTDRCALCNKQLANHTANDRHCPLPGRPGRAGIRSYSRTAVFTPKPLPNQAPGTKNKEPISKSPRSKRGRPKKPKNQHAVTLTLTLPNAAFRTHLKRTAKACGHKTPSALIIATFPLPVSSSPCLQISPPTP